MDKVSLINVFLSENNDNAKDKTNKHVDSDSKKSNDDDKIKDINKELENYKSILEGPFDDSYAEHEKNMADREEKSKSPFQTAYEKHEKDKEELVKNDEPFSGLKECGLEMSHAEHEALETPEEERLEHMPGGYEYNSEEPEDYIVIKIGHSADEEMSKTGLPAFNVGKKDGFVAAGGPNFKDGIDDNLNEELEDDLFDSEDMDTTAGSKPLNPDEFEDDKEESEESTLKESVSPLRWQHLAGISKKR